MSILRKLIVPAAAVLTLTSCPYDGKVPLDAPQDDLFDPALVGEWMPVDTLTNNQLASTRLWVMRYDANEYVVIGRGDCPTAGGRGYLSKVDGRTFMNIRYEEEGMATQSAHYGIARITPTPDGIILRQLNEIDPSAVPTSQALRSHVSARIEEPSTYYDSIPMRRTATVLDTQGEAAMKMIARACPLDPDSILIDGPISNEDAKLFLGKWRYSTGRVTMSVEIVRLDARTLRAKATNVRNDEREPGDDFEFRINVVRIAGLLFAQIHDTPDGEIRAIMRVAPRGDVIALQPLNLRAPAKSAAELRSYLALRANDPAIYYWDTFTFVRAH